MSGIAAKPERLSRRQALKIVAAAAALPAGILALRELAPPFAAETWRGESLGGPASLTLWHPDPAHARRTLARMRIEIARLEDIFSLYRPGSEISRLNRDGRLTRPSPDLVAVTDAAVAAAEASAGAFDPTVQPLWTLYERYFRANPAALQPPELEILAPALARIGYNRLDIAAGEIAFTRARMALTLNGIAQGAITDRIADLLRNEGFDHAMVELGETRAIGAAVDGHPFSVGLVDPLDPGTIGRRVELADASLSVSGGYGTRFGASLSHHIFDPATGLSAARLLDVAVIAPRAIDADALSTAIYVAGEAAAPALIATVPAASATLTRLDGTVVAI